jgi:hypothetical protein
MGEPDSRLRRLGWFLPMLNIFLLSREVWFQAVGSTASLSGTFFKGEGGGVFSRQKFSTACHFDLPAERQTGSRDPTFYDFNIDKLVKSLKSASFVIPAKAGIQ